jgi:hypothetical protein
MSLKLDKFDIGTEFYTYGIKAIGPSNRKFYNFINRIDPDHAWIFGKKKEDVIKLKCTILANDISVKRLYTDQDYDENCIDYLMGYDTVFNTAIIMHNIKVFNCCYPYGADAIVYATKDTSLYKKGDRTGYLCRLKVEEV